MSRGAFTHVIKLGLLVSFVVFALSACGGGGGGQQAEQQKEQTKVSAIPEAGKPLSPGTYRTTEFKRALSFEVVDEGWAVGNPDQPNWFFFGYGPQEAPLLLGFAIPSKAYDPERLPKRVAVAEPEDWVAWYRNHPYLKTGKPTSVSVGGASGVQFEAEVSSVPGDEQEIPLWQMGTPDSEWIMWRGVKDQITVLDVGGETVIIDVAAPEDRFEELLPKAQKVVETVEWEGA